MNDEQEAVLYTSLNKELEVDNDMRDYKAIGRQRGRSVEGVSTRDEPKLSPGVPSLTYFDKAAG